MTVWMETYLIYDLNKLNQQKNDTDVTLKGICLLIIR